MINIDSNLVNELSNEKIIKLLLQPNRALNFDMDIIQKCLHANSIYSLRKEKSNEVIVTHSNRSDISIGTVLIYIDSYFVQDLCNEKISELLLEPNRTFQFDMDIIRKCLQANSIYALRKGKSNEVIVTHSNRSNIPIGTVLLKIDSHDVHELNNESIYNLLVQPNRIIQFSKKDNAINDVVINDDAINDDAKQYGKQYDSFTQFDVCGVCAAEYGPIHLKPITEHDNLISSSKIDVFYNNILQTLSNNHSSSYYERYANTLKLN